MEFDRHSQHLRRNDGQGELQSTRPHHERIAYLRRSVVAQSEAGIVRLWHCGKCEHTFDMHKKCCFDANVEFFAGPG